MIQDRVKEELKNFFFFNKGKLFCVVAAIGALLAVPVSVLDVIPKKEEARIEFVDIQIDENGVFPILDVKIRNSGDSVAYLYGLKIHILDQFQMQNIYRGYQAMSIEDEDIPFTYIDSSTDYEIELKEEKEQIFDISQAVYPDDVDRFMLTLIGKEGRTVIYYLYMELLYNDESTITSSRLILPLSCQVLTHEEEGANVDIEKMAENYEALLRFDSYTDAIRSREFDQIFTSYKERVQAFMVQ